MKAERHGKHLLVLPTTSGEKVVHREHDTTREDIVPAICLISRAAVKKPGALMSLV